MKKIIAKSCAIILAIIALISCLFAVSGCHFDNNNSKFKIVCTIFPQYDWVRQIVGENDSFEITLLMQDGTDMHSYELTFSDMAKIAQADMFIYIGGESDDAWVDKAISNATNKNLMCVNLLEVLGDRALDEEDVPGADVSEEDEEETELDEHIWLSLKNTSYIIEQLAQKVGSLDIENAQTYIDNANAYLACINALDSEYEQAVQNANTTTIVVADRFPFRYMVEDYNLAYFGAFPGCSTEVNASASTITFLANKVDELDLKNIIIIDGSNGGVANAVVSATTNKNQRIVCLNSMQTITRDDIQKGATYLSIMQQNLQVLKEVLANE